MNNQTTAPDQEDRDSIRLANCYSLVREIFPELTMLEALKTAAALQAAIFKE